MKPYKSLLDFPLRDITWQDPYVLNAFEKEEDYLLSYEPDRLIASFRDQQGLEPKAESYGGWEKTELRGHIFGHYLKAVALTYERTGRQEFKERLLYCFAELDKCQAASGYLSAFPEELFDRIERGGRAWAPWYTMHKILAGLAEGYRATADKTAALIMKKLALWAASRTERWTPEVRAALLTHEYGGMNDVLYDIYSLTKDERILNAAHAFDEVSLFARLREPSIFRGLDPLSGLHANTTIPKFIGAMRRYEVLGDGQEFYKEAAEGFWKEVTDKHTYITGGHSDLEHFGIVGHLNEGRSDSNDETCNVYNMLKLSRQLYMATGNVAYMDFYETAFINMILASQNPETGMTTYFQSLLTGAFKVFGTAFGKFWCCTGTGMESFSKLGDSIYFHDQRSLYINSYFSTTVAWREQGLVLQQKADLYSVGRCVFTVVSSECKRPVRIALRIPKWISNSPAIELNGQITEIEVVDGYAVIERKWVAGDTFVWKLTPKLGYSNLPDSPNTVGFTFGPLVLSALLGTEDMKCNYTGANMDVELITIDVTVPTDIFIDEDVESWLHELDSHFVREGDQLRFDLKDARSQCLTFVPYFSQYKERYGIYWNLKTYK